MEVNEHSLWPGWTTVGVLGQGSYGTVYEIRRDLYGTVEASALKVISIPKNEADLDEMRGEGYSEAAIAARLDELKRSIVSEYTTMAQLKSCPYIVQPQDIMMVQHTRAPGSDVLIRMELLTPIKKDLARFQSEREVIRLARDLCGALLLCRERHIIHRDIKPENIFVSRDGTYKLGDFGIAKVVTGTMGGTVTGTYRYMAPEVYKGEPYGFAVDMYSLGMVLYWLLNDRRLPFTAATGGSSASTMTERDSNRKRLSGVPLPPPLHGSPELKRIVLKAAAFAVRDRYLSPQAMLDDLERLMSAPTPQPEPDILMDAGYDTLNAFAMGKDEEGTLHMFGGPKPAPPVTPPAPPQPEPIPDPRPIVATRIEREEKKPSKKFWLIPVLAAGLCTLAGITVLVLLLTGVLGKAKPFTGSPERLTVTDQGDGSAMLTWTPVEGADGYIIRSEALGYSAPVRVVEGEYSDVLLDNEALHMHNAEIRYTVTAFKDKRNERVESENCAAAALTCICSQDEMSVTNENVYGFWVRLSREHPEGVTVQRSIGFGAFETVISSLTADSYCDTPADAQIGDIVLYRVVENGKVLGTVGAAVLDAPASVSVSSEPEGNLVTWEPCEGADGYVVICETETGFDMDVTKETRLLDIPEGTKGEVCRYTVCGAKLVRSHFFAGFGAAAADEAVHVPAVRNLSASANGAQVTLSWQPEEGITGYQVLRTVGSGEEERVARVDAPDSQWTDTQRFDGQVVSYRVRAFLKKDTNYFGEPSEKVFALSFSGLNVTKCRSADPSDLTVGWSEVAGADGFRITAVDQDGNEVSGEAKGGHRRGFVLHSLTSGMVYRAWVSAYVEVDGVKVYSTPSPAVSAKVK